MVRYRAPATAEALRDVIDRLCGGGPIAAPAVGRMLRASRIVAVDGAGDRGDLVWHCASVEAVAAHFATSVTDGLSDAAAAAALARSGANIVPEPPSPSRIGLVVDQVATFPVALLAASAVLSIATGGLADAVAIAVVVAINATIGYVTERDAERTIRSLGRLDEGEVAVIRGGEQRRLAAADVVPGDLMKLLPGTAIAADARVVVADSLTVDESPLTGESVSVTKTSAPLAEARIALADRRNMVFKGTSVVSGQGSAIVVATGGATEIGRIETLAVTATPPQTSLQRQLDRMGRHLVWVSLGACGLTLALGLLRGHRWLAMVKSSISLAVAAVPEGLPTVATVTLALGIGEMRRHHAVVRKLQAVETLGSVTVVCFDKTGTLTENRMRAVAAVLAGEDLAAADREPLSEAARWQSHCAGHRLLEVCALCTDADVRRDADGALSFAGTATEQALLRLAVANGIDVEDLRSRYPLLATQYRAPGRNYMITRHAAPADGELLAVKGNPEDVLALCHSEANAGSDTRLTEPDRARIGAANEALAARGCRVLGFASGAENRPLTWLGLVGLADPIRPNLAALTQTFHGAGIRTVLITGDQSATAYAVARALDLSGGDTIEILEGLALDGADPQMLGSLAKRTQVFARVSPADKLAIVRALQSQGDAVAMTGDGINDGPALRAADIGVTLGSASHMAHQLADLVLADDRVETMAVAVREGRTIFRNIRKAIRFLLATNLSEILVMLSATGLALGPPLTPAQLLWINIVSDVFPGLGLAVDPPDPDVLQVPPRAADAAIFAPKDFAAICIEGAVITFGALLATLGGGGGAARYSSAAIADPAGAPSSISAGRGFLALTVGQLLHALAGRSETETILNGQGRPANRRLQLAVGALIAAQAGVFAVPPLRRLLGLDGLRLADVAIAGSASLASFAANQAIKKARSVSIRTA